jgi:hypothetical protein
MLLIISFLGLMASTPTITSSTGSMLLNMYHDNDYSLAGFIAFYQISVCPLNCSNNATCVNGQCICPPGFSGSLCANVTCLLNCSSPNGRCSGDLSHCVCNPGYFGASCEFVIPLNGWGQVWIQNSSSSSISSSMSSSMSSSISSTSSSSSSSSSFSFSSSSAS